MLFLGVDPGSNVTGYGLVTSERGRYHLVDAGVVTARMRSGQTPDDGDTAERLQRLHEGLTAVLARHRPDAAAIEAIFHHKSSESAIRLGQARGVALLALAQAGLSPVGYNPMVVKRTIGAHGRADKEGVAKMVRMLLGADLDLPADATDALAIAMTHAAHLRIAAPARPRGVG
jgi:crossover junction endodeoxyribonuclease RuvC